MLKISMFFSNQPRRTFSCETQRTNFFLGTSLNFLEPHLSSWNHTYPSYFIPYLNSLIPIRILSPISHLSLTLPSRSLSHFPYLVLFPLVGPHSLFPPLTPTCSHSHIPLPSLVFHFIPLPHMLLPSHFSQPLIPFSILSPLHSLNPTCSHPAFTPACSSFLSSPHFLPYIPLTPNPPYLPSPLVHLPKLNLFTKFYSSKSHHETWHPIHPI
jgi:hypothetical protein